MFCHKCGAKLVNGALFCSKCGTRVPEEIVKEMEGTAASSTPVSVSPSSSLQEPEPVPTSVSEPESEPEPMPEPEPEPMPEPEPKSEPMSEPEPEPAPEPAQESEPEPEPMPEPVPAPAPVHVPTPVPEPEPAPEPEPESEPTPEPEPGPARESEPVPVPVPEEKIYLPVTVTYSQLQQEETLLLQDEQLAEPLQLTLRKGMKHGMRLRLTNAKTVPAANGAKRIAVVKLFVVGGPSAAAKTEPTPAQPPVRQTPPRKTVSFAPIHSACNFQLCAEGALVTGYKFGGADEGGTIDIAPSGLTLYRKSMAVGLAFGAIGSAIEGKGKQIATIRPEDIKSFEKNTKNGRFLDYRIHLKDGRVLKVSFVAAQLDSVISAADKFLSQI
ncbi:MAG: zinc ribbon domain-containing protein [Clostridia bacterium]|nr:zinc ribbon domain-containing protein [Clostridia bacterium]